MRLAGKLNEIPLPQLIETFCHERQTGQLRIDFPQQLGLLYFQDGELVHAEVGAHSGVEAVYLALTFAENASFEFAPGVLSSQRTIHESWRWVLLEGFCRLRKAVSKDAEQSAQTTEPAAQTATPITPTRWHPLVINRVTAVGWRRVALAAAVMISALATVAAISGMFGKKEAAGPSPPPNDTPAVQASTPPKSFNALESIEMLRPTAAASESVTPQPSTAPNSDATSMPVKDIKGLGTTPGRQQSAESEAYSEVMKTESERAPAAVQEMKGQIIQPAPSSQTKAATTAMPVKEKEGNTVARTAMPPISPAGPSAEMPPQPQQEVRTPGANKQSSGQQVIVVVMQVENGRITQAYIPDRRPGMEAYETAALRIARALRYPVGKTGTENVSIKVDSQERSSMP